MPDISSPPLAPSRDTLLTRINHARERWRDNSLSLLLVVQSITIFGIVPASALGMPLTTSGTALLLVVFMSITIVMAPGRWTLSAGIACFSLTVAGVASRRFFDPSTAIEMVVTGFTLATFGVLSLVVGLAVFRPGPFTGHRLRGAVVLYLNFGLLFGILYRIVAELAPGAYTHLPDATHEAALRAACDYLSFVTLTSVGYGDIVPVNPIARSLCTLEAAIGHLLPTVLIGRAVILAMRE